MVLVVGGNVHERTSGKRIGKEVRTSQTYNAMDDDLRVNTRGTIRKLSAACMKQPLGLIWEGLGGGEWYETVGA